MARRGRNCATEEDDIPIDTINKWRNTAWEVTWTLRERAGQGVSCGEWREHASTVGLGPPQTIHGPAAG